jgi:hypothetical protein
MKKQIRPLIFLITVFIFVVITGLCSCNYYAYPHTPTQIETYYHSEPTKMTAEEQKADNEYQLWRAEQLSKGMECTGKGARSTDLDVVKNMSTNPNTSTRIDLTVRNSNPYKK